MTWLPSAVLVPASALLVACGADHAPTLDNPDVLIPDALPLEDSQASVDGPYVSKAPHCTRIGEPDAESPDPSDAGDDSAPDGLALPQVIDLGGPTMNEPTFIAVTFAGDPFADELEDYVASVGCTEYWHAVTAEYGVGNAVAGSPVRLTESAPATIADPQITSWLERKIDGGDPQFTRPGPQTVYVIFYPDSTTITVPDPGGTSCVSFGGYHSATTLADGSPLSYAVIPRCAESAAVSDPQAALLATVTAATSHELVEATTDPQPPSNPAYGQTDPAHLAWYLAGLTEIADLCSLQSGASFEPQGYPWYVARAWSNHAASLGDNPCMPAETSNYFYAAPVLVDPSLVRIDGVLVTAPTVQIPVSATATIDVRMTSNFSSGPIDVRAADGSAFVGGSPYLTLSLDRTTAMPGDTIHLTVHKQSANPDFGAEPFVLITTLHGVDTLFWGMTSD